MRVLLAAILAVGCVASPEPDPPPPPPRLTMHELVAVRRLDAHDAAVRRNAAAQQACDRWHEALPSVLRVLYRPLYGERAAPGTEFDDDHPLPFQTWTDDVERTVFVTIHADTTCWPNEDPDVFCPFRCVDNVEDNCRVLDDQLVTAWGESESFTWLDREQRIRAAVRADGDCKLMFQSYVPPRAWIATNETAQIPLALLGRSMHELPARAEEVYPYNDDHRFTWPLAVTGEHVLNAHMVAVVNRGRIARFEVDGECDADGGADELHELVRSFRRVHVRTWSAHFELVAE
jgi:hypothetical protein